MSSYPCEHCQRTFTSKSNLSRHQSRARYCLQARGMEIKYYTCQCSSRFTRKDDLHYHQKTCDFVKNHTPLPPQGTSTEDFMLKVIEDYKDMIKGLQKQITELSLRPTKVTNHTNVLNNLQPITDEDLRDQLENLTIDFILEGAKGFVDFADSYPFKDRVLCTDKARKKLRYKDEEGELVDDGGGHKLIQKFFQAISSRNEELISAEYSELQQKVEHIAKGCAHTSDLTGILSKATSLQTLLQQCKDAAEGKDNDLTQEFIKHYIKIL